MRGAPEADLSGRRRATGSPARTTADRIPTLAGMTGRGSAASVRRGLRQTSGPISAGRTERFSAADR